MYCFKTTKIFSDYVYFEITCFNVSPIANRKLHLFYKKKFFPLRRMKRGRHFTRLNHSIDNSKHNYMSILILIENNDISAIPKNYYISNSNFRFQSVQMIKVILRNYSQKPLKGSTKPPYCYILDLTGLLICYSNL